MATWLKVAESFLDGVEDAEKTLAEERSVQYNSSITKGTSCCIPHSKANCLYVAALYYYDYFLLIGGFMPICRKVARLTYVCGHVSSSWNL